MKDLPCTISATVTLAAHIPTPTLYLGVVTQELPFQYARPRPERLYQPAGAIEPSGIRGTPGLEERA